MRHPPPAYPRVPHLTASGGTGDDRRLTPASRTRLLSRELLVEEKLDGANVVIWPTDGWVDCALRSGPGAMDRAGQLGPLKAWIAGHGEALRSVLGSDTAMYAEWLLLRHTVAYDRLPSHLVVLDLWTADGFADPDERTARCETAGIAVPPVLHRGRVADVGMLEDMTNRSAVASGPAEGVVVRPLDASTPRVAKLLRPGFERLDDDAWAGGRPHNLLAEGSAAWR